MWKNVGHLENIVRFFVGLRKTISMLQIPSYVMIMVKELMKLDGPIMERIVVKALKSGYNNDKIHNILGFIDGGGTELIDGTTDFRRESASGYGPGFLRYWGGSYVARWLSSPVVSGGTLPFATMHSTITFNVKGWGRFSK